MRLRTPSDPKVDDQNIRTSYVFYPYDGTTRAQALNEYSRNVGIPEGMMHTILNNILSSKILVKAVRAFLGECYEYNRVPLVEYKGLLDMCINDKISPTRFFMSECHVCDLLNLGLNIAGGYVENIFGKNYVFTKDVGYKMSTKSVLPHPVRVTMPSTLCLWDEEASAHSSDMDSSLIELGRQIHPELTTVRHTGDLFPNHNHVRLCDLDEVQFVKAPPVSRFSLVHPYSTLALNTFQMDAIVGFHDILRKMMYATLKKDPVRIPGYPAMYEPMEDYVCGLLRVSTSDIKAGRAGRDLSRDCFIATIVLMRNGGVPPFLHALIIEHMQDVKNLENSVFPDNRNMYPITSPAVEIIRMYAGSDWTDISIDIKEGRVPTIMNRLTASKETNIDGSSFLMPIFKTRVNGFTIRNSNVMELRKLLFIFKKKNPTSSGFLQKWLGLSAEMGAVDYIPKGGVSQVDGSQGSTTSTPVRPNRRSRIDSSNTSDNDSITTRHVNIDPEVISNGTSVSVSSVKSETIIQTLTFIQPNKDELVLIKRHIDQMLIDITEVNLLAALGEQSL
jgi:hypothetical protein